MQIYFDIARLASLVRYKRGDRALREVVAEIKGISASTLSRVENFRQPDMDSFIALCNWLQVEPGNLFLISKTQELDALNQDLDTIEEVTALLMSDRKLDPRSAHILVRIIKAAYLELLL